MAAGAMLKIALFVLGVLGELGWRLSAPAPLVGAGRGGGSHEGMNRVDS